MSAMFCFAFFSFLLRFLLSLIFAHSPFIPLSWCFLLSVRPAEEKSCTLIPLEVLVLMDSMAWRVRRYTVMTNNIFLHLWQDYACWRDTIRTFICTH